MYRKKKWCIASSDLFFSPLSDVLLMLMTDFLQRTALNHCRWCGMEENRSGRHVLDHWRRRCVGDNKCRCHVLDHWRRRCTDDNKCRCHVFDYWITSCKGVRRCRRHVLGHWRELCVGDGRSWRHVLDHRRSWHEVWDRNKHREMCLEQIVSWIDRVLNRSCLEQIVSWQMRQGLRPWCASSDSCFSCSDSSGSSWTLWKVTSTCAQAARARRSHCGRWRRLVMVFLRHNTWSRNWIWRSTVSWVRIPGPGPLLWTSATLHKSYVLVSLRRHIKTKGNRADVSWTSAHKACRAAVQRQPLEELQLPSIFVMHLLKNWGFGDPWTPMRAKTADACCVGSKRTRKQKQTQKITRARWPLGREDFSWQLQRSRVVVRRCCTTTAWRLTRILQETSHRFCVCV